MSYMPLWGTKSAPSPVNGVMDVVSKIGSALTSGVEFYGQAQANKSAADLARAQAAAPAASSSSSDIPWMPIIALGGAGVLAFMLLKKKG